jgi:hypothetical protein
MNTELSVATQRKILKLERRVFQLERQIVALKAKHQKEKAKLEAENHKLRNAPAPLMSIERQKELQARHKAALERIANER